MDNALICMVYHVYKNYLDRLQKMTVLPTHFFFFTDLENVLSKSMDENLFVIHTAWLR